MRKIFLAAATGLLCITLSCNNDTTTGTTDTKENSTEQRNLAASHVIDKAFETGDVSGIDSVVADDFVDHTERGDIRGKDSLKAMIQMIHTTFKDMKMEKIHEAAAGDYVYTWMRYAGNSDGSMGMPKGPYDMQAIEVVKYRDGKAVEHWAFMNAQEMAKMMNPPSTGGTTSKPDSAR